MTFAPFRIGPIAAALLLAGTSVSISRTASADELAEVLYQEGRQAARAKDWATACKKFRESHDREPAPGTLLNLADCEENQGKLRDALAHFDAASRLFHAGERLTYARQRAAAVERRIPKMTVRLRPTSPIGSRIVLDGAPLDTARLGTTMPVDPGEHEVVVTAPGRADVRSAVRLAEGESRELEMDAGPVQNASAPPAAAPPPALAAAEPPARQVAEIDHKAEEGASRLRTLGWVGVGVGAASFGLGIIGGIGTLEAKSAADKNCTPACNADGMDAQSRGKTFSTIGTAGFVIGAIGLAGGITLLLTNPRASTSGAIRLRPTAGGAGLEWGRSF